MSPRRAGFGKLGILSSGEEAGDGRGSGAAAPCRLVPALHLPRNAVGPEVPDPAPLPLLTWGYGS